MTGRERIHCALKGEQTDHIACGPLAVHFCAQHAGISVRDYTMSAEKLADSVIRYYEDFKPDAVWVSADTWVTAEAMGAAVAFTSENSPLGGTGTPFVSQPADLDAIPPADPSRQGRMPLMREAVERVKQQIGGEAFVIACFDQSPFSLACALAGVDRVLTMAIEDRPFLDALLERCIEHVSAYAQALAAVGPDMLSTGDSPAMMLGPALYRDVALPAEQRVFETLRQATDAWISLHICGDARLILTDMVESAADLLELDSAVPMADACEAAQDRVALWGNLDPVRTLQQGSPEKVRQGAEAAINAVREAGCRRFILSSGCGLAPDTPAENLHALMDTARNNASL